MKKLLISIILLLLFLPLTIATYDYPGYDTKTLEGVWGLTAPSETGAIGLTNNMSYHTPLMGDLNNDGTNELVIIDGNNIEVYHGKTLQGIDGLNAQDTIQHAILYDITGDSNTEIITVGGNQVTIFTYNSSDKLTILNNYTIGTITAINDFMVGCKAANDCIMVNAQQTAGSDDLTVERFNVTGMYNETVIRTNINNQGWYLPLIRNIQVDNSLYIFSSYGYSGTNTDILYVKANNDDLGISLDHSIRFQTPDILSEPGRNDFTSPLVANFDPTTSGNEVVIGYQENSLGGADQFEIAMYSEAGAKLDEYPSILQETDGNIVSNIIRANAFGSGTEYLDFCVMGYDTDDDELYLLCGSERSGTTIETREMSIGSLKDLSEVEYPNVIIHSVQTSETTTDGVNLNEILTPLGLFNLEPGGGIIDGSLVQVWGYASYDNPVMIPMDLESNGKFDVIRREIDTVKYLDDGFTNEQIDITNLKFSKSPICINRTYTLTVTTDEPEGETSICYVQILYENETLYLNMTNKTKTDGMLDVKFYPTFNTTGIMFLDVYCTDQVNTPADMERRQIEIIGQTGLAVGDTCFEPGDADEDESFVVATEDTVDETFNDGVDDAFESIGFASTTAKNLLALCLCTLLAVLLYLKTNQVLFGASGYLVGAIGCFFLGLMTLFPLMIMIIISILIIVLNLKQLGSAGG